MRAEDTVEDLVHVAQLALEVEGVVEVFGSEELCDAGVVCDALAKAGFGFPGSHGVFLDSFVGVISWHALFDKVLQQLAGIDESLGGFEVAEHALRKDAHLADDSGHFREHISPQDGAVRKNGALDRAMRYVAFMPESNVVVGRHHVAAHNTRQSTNLLAGDRVALVGHGGAAALFAAEMLLGFANFGALEMANFQRNFFKESGDERKCAHVVGVAIALNHLGSDWRDGKAEALANLFLDFRA